MATSHLQPSHPQESALSAIAKRLQHILLPILIAFLAFIFYLVVHEGGHLLGDLLVYSNHGTSISAFKVRILPISFAMENGVWSGPMWSPTISSLARTDLVMPAEPFPLTDGEAGFMNLMGSGTTTLVALIFVGVLCLRKKTMPFSWFISAFILSVLILDQFLYTFISSNPEPLVSAVQIGFNPDLFKALIIALILLEGWLFVHYVIAYFRVRRAANNLLNEDHFKTI